MPIDETENNIDKASYKYQIEEKLEKARFRYNLFRCERVLFFVLTIGLTVTLITLVARKFLSLPSYTYIALIALFSIFFIVNLATVIRKWVGKSDAASLLDKKMGFKERLITGLEYADQNEDNKLFGLLVDEIKSKLDDNSIKNTLPHEFPRSTKYLIAVSILLLIFLLLPYISPVEPVIETTKENDTVAGKEAEITQEEKAEETQQEQEDRILAETKTEQSGKDQEEKDETQLQTKTSDDIAKEEQLTKTAEQEQQKKEQANSLQNQISDLFSSINTKLDQLEGKTKPEEKDESKKHELTGKEKTEDSDRKDDSAQITEVDKEQLDDKKEELSKTPETSGSDKEEPEKQKKEEEQKQEQETRNNQQKQKRNSQRTKRKKLQILMKNLLDKNKNRNKGTRANRTRKRNKNRKIKKIKKRRSKN